MSSLAECIASLALSTFARLPSKCKPRVSLDGKREWTPMSAVVIALNDGPDANDPRHLVCISLATGTKCLSSSTVPKCKGMVLHDTHAEVLALRGFNYWLLSEIQATLECPDYTSDYIERIQSSSARPWLIPGHPPFQLRHNTKIYLFTTTAPCGDASMELLITSKSPEDSIPWSTTHNSTDRPLGRGHFSHLGAVRRKPARADAEATMSKSCTDKIALKQFTGLLSFPTNLFVARTKETFLAGLVVYKTEYDATGFERAFGPKGRLKVLGDAKIAGNFFDVLVLQEQFEEFVFAKDIGSKATNLAALFISGCRSREGIQETLINGVRQGFKQWDTKEGKTSVVCRKRMVEKALHLCQLLHHQGYPKSACAQLCSHRQPEHTYSSLKNAWRPVDRAETKATFTAWLGGWVSNAAEDDFSIDTTVESMDISEK